ncbi:hypothetical protein ACB092_01G301900 [Castanea dentata]
MASSSSSAVTPSAVTDTIITSCDLSLRKSTAYRLNYLYEISHVPEDSKIPITDFPIVNPYTVFDKPQKPFKKFIKKFLGPSHPSSVKEYVQASKFNQFNIPASEKENFITLALPREFVIPWQRQGYTHLHFGAVRLALTFHGKKGLPIASRIALLDSRFIEYHNAVIGTVQTTLNAGTVFVTLFPNFNMSLKDPHLYDALKVQVQITGASQVHDTFAATLHYQLAYRLQNHAFDVDPGMTPMCTFVPRQLNKDQMKKLFPESWITKYETLHQASQLIQSNTPFFIRNQNGDAKVRFMIAALEKEEDVCDCEECREEEIFEEEEKRRKKKSPQQLLKERYEAGDPEPLPCYMFDHASPSYSQIFPPLESFDHPQTNVKHVWKIKNPAGTNPDGSKKQVSSAEAVLNWQAENAVAQNQVLSKILDNQQKLTEAVTHTFSSSNSLIEDLKKKIKSVEQELETIVSTDFFTILHNEFLGSLAHYTVVARDEFLLMKCCSFERKDLEKHFDRMSSRYYAFNSMDDVNSKHTFLNSFLKPLGDETLRMMNL